jgi:hypothetical protein
MKRLDIKWVLWIMLIYATGSFDMPLGVRIPLSEVLAFSSIPVLFRGINLGPYMPRLQVVLGVLALWFLGSVLSDVVNQNYYTRGIRGASKPVFTFMWMLFFVGVLHKDYRLLLFGVIGGVMASLQNYVMPQGYSEEYMASGGYEAAAFGLTPIANTCMAAVAVWLYMKHRLYSVVAFFIMAVLLVVIGAPRSGVAIALMTSGALGYMWWVHSCRGRHGFRLSFGRLLMLGVLGTVALYGIYELYVLFAQHGWLGEYQRTKLISQSQTVFGNSPIGLVLAGRPQFFGALIALRDYPILGSGSWTAWLMTDYFYEAMVIGGADPAMLKRLVGGAQAGVGHSIVLQLWLENGLLALIALLSTFWISTKVFLATIQRDNWLTPIIVGAFIAFVWSFFFSPFGTGSRKLIGMFLALYIVGFPQVWQGYRPLRRLSDVGRGR